VYASRSHILPTFMLAGILWGGWAKAFWNTQFVETYSLWPQVIVLSIIFIGFCTWRGSAFTLYLAVDIMILLGLGAFLIWLSSPFFPLSGILSVPEPDMVRDAWSLHVEEPAPDPIEYYISLCTIFVMPVALFARFVSFGNLMGQIATIITILSGGILIYQAAF
jgi:hypothetical protein